MRPSPFKSPTATELGEPPIAMSLAETASVHSTGEPLAGFRRGARLGQPDNSQRRTHRAQLLRAITRSLPRFTREGESEVRR